jgi:phytoene synthase
MRSIDQPRPFTKDLAECRDQLRVGSRSFHAAAFLLPRSFCEPASALYAFCRIADDAVDNDPNPDQALAQLHQRLDALYRGVPHDDPADRALAQVVQEFAIPKRLFEALFEGFAWDASGRRYANLDELLDYAARVAGTVGAMMALLMGVRDPDRLARACDLGAAMQLSNIARDVGEDARAGRVYLPLDWLDEAGIVPDRLIAAPAPSAELGQIVQRLLFEADGLYRRADSGIARLPWRCRPAIFVARSLYAEIGREVERQACDSISRRAVVSPWRKVRVLARLRRLATLPTPFLDAPALGSTAFLVNAAATAPVPEVAVQPASTARLSFMLDMIEELNRRDREAELALAQESGSGTR